MGMDFFLKSHLPLFSSKLLTKIFTICSLIHVFFMGLHGAELFVLQH